MARAVGILIADGSDGAVIKKIKRPRPMRRFREDRRPKGAARSLPMARCCG